MNGHPKLKNDPRRPQMEEIGDRTTVFEFGGLRDRQRDYIDWVLKNSVEEGVAPEDVITDTAATRLAAKLKTPLQIGQHLVRAFEAAFEIGAKPVDENVVEAVLSLRIDDLEPLSVVTTPAGSIRHRAVSCSAGPDLRDHEPAGGPAADLEHCTDAWPSVLRSQLVCREPAMKRPSHHRGGPVRPCLPGYPISVSDSDGGCAIPRHHGSASPPGA